MMKKSRRLTAFFVFDANILETNLTKIFASKLDNHAALCRVSRSKLFACRDVACYVSALQFHKR